MAATIQFYNTNTTSKVIHGSTEDFAYTLSSEEEAKRRAPGDMCVLIIALANAGGALPVVVPIHRYEYYEALLVDLFATHFPNMARPRRVFFNDLLRIMQWASACHRCDPYAIRYVTPVVRIGIYPHPRPDPPPRVKPASKASVAHLLDANKNSSNEEEAVVGCVICMEQIETRKSALRMPCSHLFHQACLLRWLDTNHVCPLCRYKLPS